MPKLETFSKNPQNHQKEMKDRHVEKVVFISDIHANLEALEAVSIKLPKFPIYCLGDIIGYGANPNESVDWVKRHCALSVLGNHDNAVLTGDVSWFNPEAQKAILWTRRILSRENREYLQQLHTMGIVRINESRMLLVHGSPIDPLYEYVDPSTHEYLFEYYLQKFGVEVVAMGHTHIPYLYRATQGTIFNPGSVGQPRSGNPQASYALLQIGLKDTLVEHMNLEYNIDAAAKKILQAGLPSSLAARLYRGT